MNKPYKRGKRLFLYDEKNCIVQLVAKMNDEDKRENEEWKQKHNGRPLFDTDETGEYMILDGVGLRRENWKNKETRDMYLDEWNGELDEENYYMMQSLKEEFGL